MKDAIYVQTNDAERNEVLAFGRAADGTLVALGSFATGGRGSGQPHLASQGSLALSSDGRRLLVTNAGSDDVSALAVEEDGLRLIGRVPSGGSAPRSVAIHGSLAYVLNTGEPAGIAGLRLGEEDLAELRGSLRPLSRPDADPAQIAFSPDGRTLVVTERGTDAIATFSVDEGGYADGPQAFPSSGATPYGFDFTPTGALVVTEAAGGAVGAASASSYTLAGSRLAPVSAKIGNTRSEVCWAAVTRNGRFAYVTNFGDGTISSYTIGSDGSIELLDPVAATTVEGEKGVRDEAITGDGRYLYAIDADARKLFGWSVGRDGALAPVAELGGLPATVAGLAAS
jgi:6-phosphogluconolactonase